MNSVRAQFDQYELVIRQQAARIAELEAEVERLRAASGAHGVLKSIYLNGELPESLRAKAASAALPHEVPKLMPERQALELKAEPEPVPLLEIAEMRKKRAELLEGQEIEVQPSGQVVVLKPGIGNAASGRAEGEAHLASSTSGNGDDSNND